MRDLSFQFGGSRSLLFKGAEDLPSGLPFSRQSEFIVSEALDSVPRSDIDVQRLREEHYNATITERIDIHSDLARFRIRPDSPIPFFEPGQYVALGLGLWEARLSGTQKDDVPEKKITKLGRRAYSISCPLLDAAGELAPCNTLDYLEFYVTLVRQASSPTDKPPVLTPRLFLKNAGDRMVVESKITGHYTLGEVDPTHTVLLIGTGTGEAPHNAMLAELLHRGHTGNIIHTTCVRSQRDLGYLAEHTKLQSRYRNYKYLPLTTREPQNLEPTHPNYVGKQYIQQYFTSGELSRATNDPLDPRSTHVYLCGNPAMIGYVPPGAEPQSQPGMLQLLLQAGFTDNHDHHGPGCVRFEKYW
jgi:ferredoxin/flavodoxin---NADP+ reductase